MILKTSCKMFSTHPPQYHPPLLAINRQEDAGEVLVHIAGTSPLVQAGPYRQLTLCIVGGAGTRLLKVKMKTVTILMLWTLRTMVTILMMLTVRTMVTIPRRPLQPKLPFFWARRAPPLTSPTSGLRWWGWFQNRSSDDDSGGGGVCEKISMDSFHQLHHIMHILILGSMTDVFSQNVMRCDIDKKTLLTSIP